MLVALLNLDIFVVNADQEGFLYIYVCVCVCVCVCVYMYI